MIRKLLILGICLLLSGTTYATAIIGDSGLTRSYVNSHGGTGGGGITTADADARYVKQTNGVFNSTLNSSEVTRLNTNYFQGHLWNEITTMKGDTGEAGAKGDTGEAGTPGLPGAKGDTGEAGGVTNEAPEFIATGGSVNFASANWTNGSGNGAALDNFGNIILGTGFGSPSSWSVVDSATGNWALSIQASTDAVVTTNNILDNGSGDATVSGNLTVEGNSLQVGSGLSYDDSNKVLFVFGSNSTPPTIGFCNSDYNSSFSMVTQHATGAINSGSLGGVQGLGVMGFANGTSEVPTSVVGFLDSTMPTQPAVVLSGVKSDGYGGQALLGDTDEVVFIGNLYPAKGLTVYGDGSGKLDGSLTVVGNTLEVGNGLSYDDSQRLLYLNGTASSVPSAILLTDSTVSNNFSLLPIPNAVGVLGAGRTAGQGGVSLFGVSQDTNQPGITMFGVVNSTEVQGVANLIMGVKSDGSGNPVPIDPLEMVLSVQNGGGKGFSVYGDGGGSFAGGLVTGGTIETMSGGIKFPDGTIQTTSATGGASSEPLFNAFIAAPDFANPATFEDSVTHNGSVACNKDFEIIGGPAVVSACPMVFNGNNYDWIIDQTASEEGTFYAPDSNPSNMSFITKAQSGLLAGVTGSNNIGCGGASFSMGGPLLYLEWYFPANVFPTQTDFESYLSKISQGQITAADFFTTEAFVPYQGSYTWESYLPIVSGYQDPPSMESSSQSSPFYYNNGQLHMVNPIVAGTISDTGPGDNAADIDINGNIETGATIKGNTLIADDSIKISDSIGHSNNRIALLTPDLTNSHDWAYYLPAQDGNNHDVLATNGNGMLTFEAPGGGNVPGNVVIGNGQTGQVTYWSQTNEVSGRDDFFFDTGSDRLVVGPFQGLSMANERLTTNGNIVARASTVEITAVSNWETPERQSWIGVLDGSNEWMGGGIGLTGDNDFIQKGDVVITSRMGGDNRNHNVIRINGNQNVCIGDSSANNKFQVGPYLTTITSGGGAQGFNDFTYNDYYTGAIVRTFIVMIDGTSETQDTFKFSNNGGSTWNVTGENCSTGWSNLTDGVAVKFDNVAGHNDGAYWSFTAYPEVFNANAQLVTVDKDLYVRDGNITAEGTIQSTGNIYADSKIGIGTHNPPFALSIVGTDQASSSIWAESDNDSQYSSSQLVLYRARGTNTTPKAVHNGDFLGVFGGAGYDGVGQGFGSGLVQSATQTWEVGKHGTAWSIWTVPNNGTGQSPRLTVDNNGNVGIGTVNPLSKLHVSELTGDLSGSTTSVLISKTVAPTAESSATGGGLESDVSLSASSANLTGDLHSFSSVLVSNMPSGTTANNLYADYSYFNAASNGHIVNARGYMSDLFVTGGTYIDAAESYHARVLSYLNNNNLIGEASGGRFTVDCESGKINRAYGFRPNILCGGTGSIDQAWGFYMTSMASVDAVNQTRVGVWLPQMPSPLSYTGTTVAAIQLSGTSEASYDGLLFANDTTLYRSSVEALTTNGRLGVGGINPNNQLEVMDNVGTNGSFGKFDYGSVLYLQNINHGNSATTLTLAPDIGSNFNITIQGSGATPSNEVVFNQRNNAPMKFFTNNTERIGISGDGITTIKGLMIVSPEATCPITSGTVEGTVWYSSSDNMLKCFNGTIWKDLYQN